MVFNKFRLICKVSFNKSIIKKYTMNFDDKALEWDNNPQFIERARLLAEEIKINIKLTGNESALEFGCGTGRLSRFLKNDLQKVTLVDTSQGMLNVLKERIVSENLTNFNPYFLDMLTDEIPFANEKFDLIYTSMTIHHVADIKGIFTKFNSFLKPNSYLIIADLDKEDGNFHSPEMKFDGHFGFDKSEFENNLRETGFEPIYYKIFLEIDRITAENIIKKYPVFVIIAKKI